MVLITNLLVGKPSAREWLVGPGSIDDVDYSGDVKKLSLPRMWTQALILDPHKRMNIIQNFIMSLLNCSNLFERLSVVKTIGDTVEDLSYSSR